MPPQEIRRIGIVGLGRMGLPMARHLATAGYDVRACDPRPEAQAAARPLGITVLPSCREVASASDAVLVVVGSQGQVERAVFGADGIATGAGSGTVLMVAATVSPSYMISLSARAAQHGFQVVDTPVARGESAAETGRLLVYAGGADDLLDRCGPVLECFAERVCRLGDVGAGQAAKTINNMLLWTCLCASVEGLDLGEAMGVGREALRDALRYGSGANWALETRADDRPALWAEKDMAIALDEARRTHCAAPLAATVAEAIKTFKAARGLPASPPDEPEVPS